MNITTKNIRRFEIIENNRDMKNITSHINNSSETYYSTTDENGQTIYSFAQDFADIWTQEDQDAIDAGSTPAKSSNE